MSRKRILAVCVGNSCRSQMLEGYLRMFIGRRADIYSAGTEAHGLNSYAIRAMAEDGTDISRQTSNVVDEYANIKFDLIITVCESARRRCGQLWNSGNIIYHALPDPADVCGDDEEILNVYRGSRDAIREFCRTLVAELNW